jgi:hypothetical protein
MMDGTQYNKPKFTLPAGDAKIDQKQWDLAFLTKAEFIEKHGEEEYKITAGVEFRF